MSKTYFNLYRFILSNFKRAHDIEAESNERSQKAEIFSTENRKEISNRQNNFKRKWR